MLQNTNSGGVLVYFFRKDAIFGEKSTERVPPEVFCNRPKGLLTKM